MASARSIRGIAPGLLYLVCAVACAPRFAGATTVSGFVTDAATGQPLATAQVAIQSSGFDGMTYGLVQAAADGSYSWTGTCELGPAPSQCQAYAFAPGYIDSFFAFDPGATDVRADFALSHTPVAWISGIVRESGSASPLGGVGVTVEYRDGADWIFDGESMTAADGTFTIEVVPDTYRVCAGGMYYGTIRQCFDHKDHGDLAAAQDQTPVTLADGQSHPDTNFDLAHGGAISGTLYDAYAATPLANAGAALYVFDRNGDLFDSADFTTDASGAYRVTGLPDGTFYASLYADAVFADRWQIYPDIVCDPLFGCPPATMGEPLDIVAASEATDVDFTLHPDVVVSGHVSDAVSGGPVASARIDVYRWESFLGYISFWNVATDANGDYSVYVAGDGTGYYIGAMAAPPLIGEIYPDVACITNPCVGTGQPIVFDSGDRIGGIDFAMPHGGAIAGRVVDATTDQPIVAAITVFDAAFDEIWRGATTDDGTYTTAAWTPGTFYVVASSFSPSACAYYDGRPCPDDGIPAHANPTPIDVALDQIHGGIDFRLLADAIFGSGFEAP